MTTSGYEETIKDLTEALESIVLMAEASELTDIAAIARNAIEKAQGYIR